MTIAFVSVRRPDQMEFKMKTTDHGSCPLRSRLAAFGSGTCRSPVANNAVVHGLKLAFQELPFIKVLARPRHMPSSVRPIPMLEDTR
jgi:hypothetical protein